MRLKYTPYALIIDQTILCNQECGFCWRTDRERVKQEMKAAPWRVMPFGLYRQIVDEAAEVESLRSLSLCGPAGEPTLAVDLAKRGAYARSKPRLRDRTLINTNGVALHKFDQESLLMAFSDIQISLDADNEEVYAAIHGKSGQFDQVVENIERLVQTKRRMGCPGVARIGIRCTETTANTGEWIKIHRRWAGQVDHFIHKHVHTFVDVLPVRPGLRATAADACNQPHGSINFSFLGDLTTCCINYHHEPTFGRLGEGKSLKELWESDAFETWRATRLSGLCHGCSGLGAESQRIQEVA